MREIKFRGFNSKNNVWLYGFYLQKRWSSESSAESNSRTAESRQSSANANRGAHFICPDEFATGKSWDDYEIDPDTRGEFSGRKDKNGKEIYEGDIVETVINGCRYVQEVVWSDSEIGFSFRGHGCGPIFHESSCMEVIGNIHDNPNLLI